MKTNILIFTLLLLMVSCNNPEITRTNDGRIVLTQEEYNQLKGDTVKIIAPEYPKIIQIRTYDFYIELGSDSHEYLTNIPPNIWMKADWTSFIHYPDCKFCKINK